MDLEKTYKGIIKPDIISQTDYQRFLERLKRGNLTKKENPTSHCCTLLLVYDSEYKKILVTHHKIAKAWFFPGGHIEPGETPPQAAVREAGEEVGLKITESDIVGPFGIQILDIDNPPQVCREHYDFFFGIPTKHEALVVNMDEFLGYDWLTVEQARERIIMPYYRAALDKFIRFMNWV